MEKLVGTPKRFLISTTILFLIAALAFAATLTFGDKIHLPKIDVLTEWFGALAIGFAVLVVALGIIAERARRK